MDTKSIFSKNTKLVLCAWVLVLISSPPLVFAQNYIEEAQSIVDSLTSPYFEGRGYVNNGDSLAADYIATTFEEAGIPPFLETYYQDFSLTAPLYPEAPTLTINGKPLELGRDFLPYAASLSGSINNQTQIVYPGSGVFYPPLNLNEYAGFDTQNAIVVVQDQVHDSLKNNSEIPPDYFSRTIRSNAAALNNAKAILFLSSPPLVYRGDRRKIPIPAFIVNKESWPGEVSRIDLSINNLIDAEVTTSNVIAFQKGTTHSDKYILIMGHYDHLGRIGPDVYFPGANDNASGIALMLTLASYFQKHPPAFNIIYIAFSGEEKGLLGSRFFVENPPLPLEQVRFLINLDMVASGQQGIMAQGGVEFQEEYELLTAINDSLETGRLSRRRNSPNSDHFYFLQKGVRGFFIYTNKGTQPYHHIDDIPETLDWDEFEDTFLLVRHFIEAIRD